MPNTTTTAVRPPSMAPTVMASTSVALGVLGVALLIAGTAAPGHTPLLAWGGVLCVVAVAVGSLASIRLMIDDSVNRCVNRVYTALQVEVEEAVANTAVKVGQAIAESLAESDDTGPPSPRAGVHQLY